MAPCSRVVTFVFAAVFVVATCLKVCLAFGYRSTDFEVHRNWLAITNSLPLTQWYYDETSEWTLDYPPFFAYFEFLLSFGANFADPRMLEVSNLNYASLATVAYQRATVMFTDVLLLAGAWLWTMTSMTVSSDKISAHFVRKASIIACLTLLNPGLFMVDHIHFQYNGCMLGLLITSLAFIRAGKHVSGAAVFACLLMFKHIFAYIVPVYFVYLVRHCFGEASDRIMADDNALNTNDASCDEDEETDSNVADPGSSNSSSVHSFKVAPFLSLVAVAVIVVSAAFGPILVAAWVEGGPASSAACLLQIKARLFPFQRGLCHAYWAPNVWAVYAFMDKSLLQILRKVPMLRTQYGGVTASMTGGLVEVAKFAVFPDILPLHTFVFSLLAMSPALFSIWRWPYPRIFVHAVVYCQFCSFMLGYHVHEKAILMAIVPLGIICVDSLADAKLYLFVSWIGHFSLFPLLHESSEEPIKVAMYMIHVVFSFVMLKKYHTARKRERKSTEVDGIAEVTVFSTLEKCYLAGLLPLYVFTNFVHPHLFRRADGSVILPFLPLLATSEYCAVGLIYAWKLSLQRFHQKVRWSVRQARMRGQRKAD
eukprot:TRINITY_DN43301_c0_g1_i1.p1 TRINITY_DN43301_c0_g1~~TRINITY_DN43301_c0_g1_i1.p1  ORF type:complete len:594 (-),score=67.54 TRINITY_DN43301_c0_g1_i1:79-1860(-)